MFKFIELNKKVMRSLIDVLLFTLGLVPSNDKYDKIKSKLNHIPLSKISSVLQKQHSRASGDRYKLVGSLDLNRETEDLICAYMNTSEGLWDKLKYCGSGINKSLFDDILVKGKYRSGRDILPKKYSKKFLDRFEYLWKRDKALRKLEWDFLKVGRIYNRDKIITSMSDKIVKTILNPKTTLIDIIELSNNNDDNNKLLHSIGKCLVYKGKHDPNIDHKVYKLFRRWLERDQIHCIVILANSLKSSGNYSLPILMSRFKNRIKSNKKLSRYINYV